MDAVYPSEKNDWRNDLHRESVCPLYSARSSHQGPSKRPPDALSPGSSDKERDIAC